jgi:hypothetical protein
MRQVPRAARTAEQHLREIRRATRKRHSAEDKIRIVLSGLPGDRSIAELCRLSGQIFGSGISLPSATALLTATLKRKADIEH